MFVSGLLMVANGPVRYYYNPAFRLKMVLFIVAVLFHFILQVTAARRSPARIAKSWWLKTGAVFSLILWLGIGVAGRAIGYV